jgi:release factor glutamine methyltransferase
MSSQHTSGDEWTVGRLLGWTADWLAARGSESPRLDAEVLLAHVRGCQRIELYTAFGTPVDEPQRGRFRELVKRRGDGEPVAYLVGSREFFSLPFRVNADVLVPRPETEGLVVRVLDLCRGLAAPRIADVGTGSGAIAVTLARHLPQASLVATDISPGALEVARDNAARHGVADRVSFVHCDLLDDPQGVGPWDVIVSNPPYVREDEFAALPRDVRQHEPRTALVSGPTGVEVIARLAAVAAERLAAGGWLVVEVGPAAAAEAAIAAQAGLTPGPTLSDLAGLPRIVQARRS